MRKGARGVGGASEQEGTGVREQNREEDFGYREAAPSTWVTDIWPWLWQREKTHGLIPFAGRGRRVQHSAETFVPADDDRW